MGSPAFAWAVSETKAAVRHAVIAAGGALIGYVATLSSTDLSTKPLKGILVGAASTVAINVFRLWATNTQPVGLLKKVTKK